MKRAMGASNAKGRGTGLQSEHKSFWVKHFKLTMLLGAISAISGLALQSTPYPLVSWISVPLIAMGLAAVGFGYFIRSDEIMKQALEVARGERDNIDDDLF